MDYEDSPDRLPDSPPLMRAGRHVVTISALRERCVNAFSGSSTRQAVFAGVVDVVTKLTKAKITGELWIDGSFLTEKSDAKDADIVLRIQGDFYDSATDEQQAAVDWLNSNLHDSHLCDTYLLIEWPNEHEQYWAGHCMYCYWMKQWGFSRQNELKGIAVIELPYSNPAELNNA